MLKQTWPQMVISQCGPPAILASDPFRKERGKSGAPRFVCDLDLRLDLGGLPVPKTKAPPKRSLDGAPSRVKLSR
jgi:hypothetical protein